MGIGGEDEEKWDPDRVGQSGEMAEKETKPERASRG